MKIKKKNQFYDIQKHGITQSLLSMYLECRQKARFYLQGWDSIYHKLSLTEGTVGHGVLQYAYGDIMTKKLKTVPSKKEVMRYTKRVEKQWLAENVRPNKEAFEFLQYSLATMEVTLPIYFDFWKKDIKEIKWAGLEETFAIPFKLPDGRKTVLRGKKDGEFYSKGLWLFESKFKSQISEGNLVDTLSFETQVLLYLWALRHLYKKVPQGVLYNIVRRTSLRQHKNESLVKFTKRLGADIEKRPEFYFMRFEIAVDNVEIDEFEKQLIGMVTDFYDWWQGKAPHYKNTYQCIGKYGRCTYLPACSSGEFASLKKRKAVFKELEDY